MDRSFKFISPQPIHHDLTIIIKLLPGTTTDYECILGVHYHAPKPSHYHLLVRHVAFHYPYIPPKGHVINLVRLTLIICTVFCIWWTWHNVQSGSFVLMSCGIMCRVVHLY